MFYNAKVLGEYTLHGLDGKIGKVKEFYFDDQYWAIRYLVADTGNWLTGRHVLISPYALVAVIKEKQHIAINLTKKQIEDSPSLDSDKPVSRQFEAAYNGYYGWPMYWGGPSMWGSYSYPYMAGPFPCVGREREELPEATRREKEWDSHLRSTHYVSGYHIEATDGTVGHVEDFIIDDDAWAIRYLVVDTRNWRPGKRVLISPRWIERVSWDVSKVFVNLTCEAIKQSPEYTEQALVTRFYETALHRHYDRRGYWVDEPAATRRQSDRRKTAR